MSGMGDRGVAPVVDIEQARRARAKRGAGIGRAQMRRAVPRVRAPRLVQLPGYLVPDGDAVRLKELVDGDVVALNGEDRRTWHARIGFVPARWKMRRGRRRQPVAQAGPAVDLMDAA